MAPSLLGLLRDSVAEPGETADRLLAMRPATRVLIEAALLVCILDTLVLAILGRDGLVMPGPSGDIALGPFLYTALLAVSLILSASAIETGGRLLGGRGRFAEAFLLVVWLETIAIAVQAATLLVALALPSLALVAGLAGLAVLAWCSVHFTRALHGFAGWGRALAALLLGGVVMILGLSILLALLGFGGLPDA